MDLSNKGWLKAFLDYREQQFLNTSGDHSMNIGQDPEHSFYGIIQPTGIMYGQPVQNLGDLDTSQWSAKEKVKILLIDSLLNIAALYNDTDVSSPDGYHRRMIQTLESINSFYEKVYPETSVSATNWLGKKKDIILLTEQLIDKRINMAMNDKNNFWLAFFNRNQLFLDIYIFGQWSHTKPDEILEEFFRGEKDELSYNAVKVMAAAAHANCHIEEEEESLFELFIDSLGMATEKKRVAKEYFTHGLGIQDIPVDSSDPWIIRKYLLELALLTVWSDKKVDDSEIQFLNQFNDSLGFSAEDLDKSMIAIEGFVLENWSELDSLQSRKNFEEVSGEYIHRVSAIVEKFQKRIFNDIITDKPLVELIKKGNSSNLTENEKTEITNKLVKILGNIPVFKVIALPHSFLNYSNVLRIIPAEVIKAIYEK